MKICETETKHLKSLPNTTAFLECNNNADTCCLGTNVIILKYATRKADVYAYDTSIKPIENISIVTGATSYDDDRTSQTYMLVFNKSLYYGPNLENTSTNPNQVRNYGMQFNDNPYDKKTAYISR